MSTNQHLGVDKTNAASARQQTTSTPYDNTKPKITISPGSTDVSFMGASRIRTLNNDDQHTDSFALNLKVPNMTSLFNGTKAANLSGNQSVVTTDGPQGSNVSRDAVMRMSKIVINNDAIDEELRVRENYLNQLKSIDLTKYSFPNE